MKLKAVVLSICLAVSSCATTIDSIGGVGLITKSVAKFDGAEIVDLSITRLDNGDAWHPPTTKFAAKWSSNTPDVIYLRLVYESDSRNSDSYTLFNGIKVNLDGEITEFKTSESTKLSSSNYNTVTRTIYTKSSSTVILDIEYLERMLAAEVCNIRISTNDGYEDVFFHTEVKASQRYSKSYLKDFLNEVKSI